MNFTTISSSEITSPTAAYIFGELAANPNALADKESVDIVKALFGIRTTDPSAIDITESMVKSMSTVQSNTIRTMLQDRSVSGIIWRFTTPKKFMLELEKIPTFGGHHALNLILVYMNKDTRTPSTFTRQLVRFDKNGVTWFDKKMTELDYSARNYNILVKLHDEAVAKLNDKFLKPVDPNVPKPVPVKKFKLEEHKVYTFEVNGNNVKVLNTLTGAEMFNFNCESDVQSLKAHGPTIIYEDVNITLPGDDAKDIIDRINKAIENPEEQVQEEKKVEPPPPPPEPEPTPEPTPEPPQPREIPHPQPPPKEVPEPTLDTEPIPEPGSEKSDDPILIAKEGSEVEFVRKNPDILDVVTLITPDYDGNEVEMTDPNFTEDFILGKYKVKDEITTMNLDFESVSEFMEHFELIEGHTVVKVDDKPIEVGIDTGAAAEQPKPELPKDVPTLSIESTTKKAEEIMQVARETGAPGILITANEQPIGTVEVPPSTEVTNNMAIELAIVVDQSFKDIESTLTDIVKQTVVENPGATDTEVTEAVRTCTEIDEIKVEFKDGAWNVVPDIAPAAPQEPEVPTIDLNDTNNQLNMLRGLFGVTDPAITHIEKFLKNHLTEEGNAGFLKTGTFPTETTIIYTQKPYDVTICILKYKDGRFYRCFWSKTDLSLGEAANHGYLATSDIQGRWVRLGRDIQNNVFRPEQRGRRY